MLCLWKTESIHRPSSPFFEISGKECFSMSIDQLNRNEEKGHGLAKYALMLALGAIVIVVGLALLTPAINTALCSNSPNNSSACEDTAPYTPQLRTQEEVAQDCRNRGGTYEVSYTDTYGVYTLRCQAGPNLIFQEDFN
jgi:Flp pilus assembly pilin Flp